MPANRTKTGQFAKGQSGNPKGRPPLPAKVKEYAHLKVDLPNLETEVEGGSNTFQEESSYVEDVWIDTEEVDAILERTFYANKKAKEYSKKNGIIRKTKKEYIPPVTRTYSQPKLQKEYLLIDGYNIIFAWKELSELAKVNIASARDKLLDIMCNYQGIRNCNLIVVFDAYRVEGHQTELLDYHNIHVVYTKEAETADQFIEKFAHENGKKYNVTVATSDSIEQVIIRGQNCHLLSARDLEWEVNHANEKLRMEYLEKQPEKINSLRDKLADIII